MKVADKADNSTGCQSPAKSEGSSDVENLAVFRGVGLSDDQRSFEEAAHNDDKALVDGSVTLMAYIKGEAGLDKNHHPPQPPQPWWKRHKILLIGTAAVLIIVAVVVTTVRVLASPNKESASSSAGMEVLKIDVEELQGTLSPSVSPTSSPTIRPRWDLNFLRVNTDLSRGSTDEVVMEYEIGIGQTFRSELFAGDCTNDTAITGIAFDLTWERTPKNMWLEYLTLNYSIDKGLISGSNVWNEETNQIQLCQVVQLVLEEHDFVIAEDKRTMNIDVILSVGFGIGSGNVDLTIQLGPGVGEEDNGNATRW